MTIVIEDNIEEALLFSHDCYKTAYNHLKSKKASEVPLANTTSTDRQMLDLGAKESFKVTNTNAKSKGWCGVSGQQLFIAKICRKLGHVCNEQGAFMLSKAVDLLTVVDEKDEGLFCVFFLFKQTVNHSVQVQQVNRKMNCGPSVLQNLKMPYHALCLSAIT